MSDSGETFSIRVVDDDGDGVAGVSVVCAYGAASGTEREKTDSDGWAEFPIIYPVTGGPAIPIHTVWVNGDEVGDRLYPEDGETFSFNLP